MAEDAIPTVGRIVHYYEDDFAGRARALGVNTNAVGAGPYPAVVLQVFSGAVNLLVHTWGGDVRVGTVFPKEHSPNRYWEWPPRSGDGK